MSLDELHPRWQQFIRKVQACGHGSVTLRFQNGLPMRGEHPIATWQFEDEPKAQIRKVRQSGR
jgi:hypothetical protein